jgi:DnaJ homolog subfamily C member 9
MPSTKEEESLEDSLPFINPYEVLGLASDATNDQVKSAYRKQALKHHPGTQISYESQHVFVLSMNSH